MLNYIWGFSIFCQTQIEKLVPKWSVRFCIHLQIVSGKNFLRTKVRADFKIWGTLFSAPLFSGLNQWFRPKTIWGTHQTGSQRSKRPFFDFFKKIFQKIMVFQAKKRNFFLIILFGPKCPKTCSRHNLLLFL